MSKHEHISKRQFLTQIQFSFSKEMEFLISMELHDPGQSQLAYKTVAIYNNVLWLVPQKFAFYRYYLIYPRIKVHDFMVCILQGIYCNNDYFHSATKNWWKRKPKLLKGAFNGIWRLFRQFYIWKIELLSILDGSKRFVDIENILQF